jgi:transposase
MHSPLSVVFSMDWLPRTFDHWRAHSLGRGYRLSRCFNRIQGCDHPYKEEYCNQSQLGFDPQFYKQRHGVGNLCARVMHFRSITSRFDKTPGELSFHDSQLVLIFGKNLDYIDIIGDLGLLTRWH